MGLFATEFSVSTGITKAQFAAQAFAWVRGMKDSDLFSDDCIDDLSGDHVEFEAPSGEHLWVKYCDLYRGFVAGVRHEKPDSDGVTWRSEIVLTNKGGDATLRVKVQSLSTTGAARTYRPRKPYFVKMALQDDWPVRDGIAKPSQVPVSAADLGIEVLSSILAGDFSTYLPFVYVSAPFGRRQRFNDRDLEKLAFRLGGVAHVVVEPNREFSSELLDSTGRNARKLVMPRGAAYHGGV